ncbi:hypothetical protein BD626DRAFT_475284 [Schizophyllum amplum]|uniref:Secreted protein n=1 Tax=Schizophyllum amplum TaxID=97359 RepID=A0A550CYB1_9AGAR|nr:hypothetical protein BD626DRAFT_475284 [Auriculariopsis ampla]
MQLISLLFVAFLTALAVASPPRAAQLGILPGGLRKRRLLRRDSRAHGPRFGLQQPPRPSLRRRTRLSRSVRAAAAPSY